MLTVRKSFLSIIFVASSLSAQPWRVDSTKIGGALQDSSGWVWGFGVHPNLGVYRWDGEKWLPISLAGIPDRNWPWALAKGPDGAVYFLWSDRMGNLAVSRHLGSDSKLLVRFAGRLRDRPHLFVDPGGNIWITEQGRHIFRVTPEGKAECVYTIADDQFRAEGRPKSENWVFNPIYITADGRGRVWFWSDSLEGRADGGALQGVLVFDGVKFEHHAHLAGVPDKRLSVINPDDAGRMWLAVIDDGLYRVDTSTLTAIPVPDPNFQAFRNVQTIFQTPRETYVVASSPSLPVPELSGGGRSGALWQGVGGTWKRLIDGLDMRPGSFEQRSRPFLATGDGLWIGAFGSGPWLIPARRGAEKLMDWHYGYPLDGSEGLFQLTDGRLLMVSEKQATLAVKPADLLAGFQSPAEFSTLNPVRALAQDAGRHLWGVLAAELNALSEWDGRRWVKHPVPSTFPLGQSWNPHPDSLGRIWLPFNPDGRTEDPTPFMAWDYPNFLAAGRNEGINLFGTGFGTDPVVTTSARGVTCRPTYLSDTQITCDLTIPPGVFTFNYSITSQGYNGVPFINGLVGMGVGIFDPKDQSFKTYANYDQALEAQLPLHKEIHVGANLFKAPAFSADGRICYRDTRSLVRYFDGGRWREWSTRDVSGLDRLEFEQPPFFDRAGNLAVNLRDQTWEFTNPKGWHLIAAEPDPAAERELKHPHFSPAASACAVEHPESLVQDRLGTFWFTARAQFYRAIGGQCVAQFAPDEHQPFVDSRKLRDVLIDLQGNTFLLTEIAHCYDEYVVLKARPPLPQCALRASVASSGNVILRFSARDKAASGFTWRVDGGPWNTPTKSPEATIEELPNGQHRIEAVAVDERLQMDLAPAEAVVDIHVDLDAHIRELIQKLANPDYSVREKAIAALVGRGALALPLLQSAREKAMPDQRWWIDAAIQQINEGISTHKGP